MENIQSTLYGKMWPGLFQAIKAKISAGSWKKSQKATFQYLAQVADEDCYQTAYEVRGLLKKTKGAKKA